MKNALIATFLIVIAVCFVTGAETDQTVRHTVILGGNKAGTEIGTKTGDEWHYSFEYNDRGRGPKTETRIVIGPGQIPVLIENTGVDYYKNAVTEKFSLQDGKATWKNQGEDGSRIGLIGGKDTQMNKQVRFRVVTFVFPLPQLAA